MTRLKKLQSCLADFDRPSSLRSVTPRREGVRMEMQEKDLRDLKTDRRSKVREGLGSPRGEGKSKREIWDKS